MNTYSAYFHDQLPLDGDGLVLVRERFNWFALFLPLFWTLRYQLWLAFAGYLVLSLTVQGLLELTGAGSVIGIVFVVGYRLMFAFTAPFIRHTKLVGRGYRELFPVKAQTVQDAERIVLDYLVFSTQQTTEEKISRPFGEVNMDQMDDYNN